MPTTYTPLLGFSLPATGELSGTWGDVTNASLTNLADTAIAGATTLNTDADVTLTTTTGAANQARSAIILCTGARTVQRNITAPASSKKYTVTNATTGGFGVLIRGAGPTAGVVIPAGRTYNVAWNGSDFVIIGTDAGQLSGTVPIANGGTGQTTAGAALSALGGAPIASPTFTGVPAAPTAAAATNTTQLATTAHVFAERTNVATLTNKTLTAPVVNSPTGIVKGDVGLGNVDNTSDANKPVSTATQTALNLKANLASPTFTGVPAAPTPTFGDNTTQIATMAAIQAAVAALPSGSLPSLVNGTFLTNNGATVSWGSTFGVATNWAATQTIASATTTDIGAATSNSIIVSGVTPITGLGTIAAGAERSVTFSGILTLTHNGTSLILPGGANITTAANDCARFISLGSSNWRCVSYQKANGQAVAGASTLNSITAATGSATLANGNNPIAWNWTQTTASQTGFNISETTASTGGSGSQVLMKIGTLAGSTADPLQVQTRGVDTIRASRFGVVTITGLDGTTSAQGSGSNVSVTAGAGSATGTGGTVSITGGAGGGTTGNGGDLTLTTGAASNGTAGTLTLASGAGTTAGSGNINVTVGSPGSARAGIVTITGGTSGAAQSGNSGGIVLLAGAAGATASIAGGPIVITGGAGSTTTTGGIGGAVTVTAGAGGLAAAGGALTLAGGQGGATGVGGNVNITAGAGNGGVTGGNVVIRGGTLSGGGGSGKGEVQLIGASGSSGSMVLVTGGAGTINGGIVRITGGVSNGGSAAGNIELTSGQNNSTGASGAVTLATGSRFGTGAGSNISITANNGITTGAGGAISITAGNGVSAVGGDITLTTGTGSSNGAINFVNTNVANGAVATTITSLGPTGASTTIVGWIRIKVNGTVQYQPYW